MGVVSSRCGQSSALIKNPAREGSGRGAPPFRAGVSTPPRRYRGGHGSGPGGAGQGSQAERHGTRGVTSPRGTGRNRGPQAAKHPNRDGQTHRAGSGAGLPRGGGAAPDARAPAVGREGAREGQGGNRGTRPGRRDRGPADSAHPPSAPPRGEAAPPPPAAIPHRWRNRRQLGGRAPFRAAAAAQPP